MRRVFVLRGSWWLSSILDALLASLDVSCRVSVYPDFCYRFGLVGKVHEGCFILNDNVSSQSKIVDLWDGLCLCVGVCEPRLCMCLCHDLNTTDFDTEVGNQLKHFLELLALFIWQLTCVCVVFQHEAMCAAAVVMAWHLRDDTFP